jgi:hypothetical protein
MYIELPNNTAFLIRTPSPITQFGPIVTSGPIIAPLPITTERS